jgi:hypothetical protein
VCGSHGAGYPVRVHRGERKPAGRPPTTGTSTNLDRPHYRDLATLEEQWRNDPELRVPEKRLALLQSLLDMAVERFKDGDLDELKLIEQTTTVIATIDRVNRTEFGNQLKAAVAMTGLALRAVGDCLDEHIADPVLRDTVRAAIQSRLGQIRVPVGAIA